MSKKYLYHTHHIVPKHAGGTDDPSNLIKLTVEEHSLAHRKLFFIYGRWQDELAYKTLEGRITKEEAIRQTTIKTHTGSKRTLESRKRMSIAQKGCKKPGVSIANKNRVVTQESKKKISKTHKGKKLTQEHKLKIGKAKKLYWANKRRTNEII